MTIQRFFDQSIVVSRLKNTGSVGERYNSTATVDGHIQYLDPSARAVLDFGTARAFEAWFDIDTDIEEGDRITDDRGVSYDVQEVTRNQFGINQHLYVIMTEYNQD